MPEFLLWSEKHGVWWRPESRGYTSSIREAGRYPAHAADAVCKQSNYGGLLNTLAIPVPSGLPQSPTGG